MGLLIDNFAGGGGASTGIEIAMGRPVDVAINHDPVALWMHEINHPMTRHMCEDVWKVDPEKVCDGRPVDLAWFSPDCKHFSKAKGGKPREKKIRGLAWVAVRWAKAVKPKVIMLENVEEFKTWGPLDEEGNPIKARQGETFGQFVAALSELGYEVEWRELRACDYGAPTTRKRLFLIARCDGRPIVWPEPTHGPRTGTPYRTAAECIDWTIPCLSIFGRKKPLAEATCRRIAKGIVRYVLDNPKPFIVKPNHTARAGYYQCFRGQDIDDPLQTVTAAPGFALVSPHVTKFRSGSVGHGVDEPLHTVTACSVGASNHPGGAAPFGVVSAFLAKNNFGNTPFQGADESVHTITTQGNRFGLVSAFLAKHYSGVVGTELDRPISTVTSVDHHSLVAAHVMRQFGQSVGSDTDAPMGTITAGGGGKSALAVSSLVKFRGMNTGQQMDEPIQTISAQGTHFAEVRSFLTKYYGAGTGQDLDGPLGTVTTRDRFGLVTVTIAGEPYILTDIGMRMLQPRELYRAQGFPDNYEIAPLWEGKPLTKTAQVRMVGNSVCPQVAAALVRANVAGALRESEVA